MRTVYRDRMPPFGRILIILVMLLHDESFASEADLIDAIKGVADKDRWDLWFEPDNGTYCLETKERFHIEMGSGNHLIGGENMPIFLQLKYTTLPMNWPCVRMSPGCRTS